jgi:hypothetical protein
MYVAHLLLEMKGMKARVWYSRGPMPLKWLQDHGIACIVHCAGSKYFKEGVDLHEEFHINTATHSNTIEIFDSLKWIFGVARCRRRGSCYFGP